MANQTNKISFSPEELSNMLTAASVAGSKAAVQAINESGQKAAPINVVVQAVGNNKKKFEQDMADKLSKNKALANKINNESKVYVTIPSIYAQFFQSVPASINGVSVRIPVDGKRHKIPKSLVPFVKAFVSFYDTKYKTATAVQNVPDGRGGIIVE